MSRDFLPVGDRLRFELSGPGDHRIEGFSDDSISIYRTRGPDGLARIEVPLHSGPSPFISSLSPSVGNTREVTFRANAGTGSTFEAFTAAGARVPSALEPATTAPIRVPHRSVDAVIIAPQRFHSELLPLLALRKSQGWSTELVEWEAIRDQFGDGLSTPDALQRFLKFAWSQWPAPAPRAALIVGDATYDPRGNLGVSPRQVIPTPRLFSTGLETPGDAGLGDLVGDDGVSEIVVGRLPVATVEECRAVVTKIIAHEGFAPPPPFPSLFIADDDSDFEGLTTEMAMSIAATATPLFIDLGHQDVSLDRELLRRAWQRGLDLVHYTGHGSRQTWGAESILTVADVPMLSGPRLPLVTAVNCLNGYFTHPTTPGLGEALLLEPHGGAFAYWGPTSITSHRGQHELVREFHSALSRAPGISLCEAIRTAQEMLISHPEFESSQWRLQLDSWVLLGDPLSTLR